MERWLIGLGCIALMAGCGRGERDADVARVAQTAAKDKASQAPEEKAKEPAPVESQLPPLPEIKPPSKQVTPPAPLPEVKPPPLRPEKRERPKPTQTVAVTAEAFHGAIKKDAKAAAEKFEPALVELSGVVRAVGSRGAETFVTLDAGPEATLGILCVFAEEKQPWAKLSRGQKITVRGLWPEVVLQPGLVACTIAEAGPNPAAELRAEALAEDFAKARDAVRAKYSDKPLIVTGMVVSKTSNDLGAVRIFLQGAGELRVDCGFNAVDRAEAEAVTPGQRIRLAGEFSALESSEMPALRGCRLIQ